MNKDGTRSKVWCHLRDLILLDSGSTCHTFMNSDLVKNLRKSNRPINMSTNVGSTKIDMEGDVPPLNKVHFDPSGIANVAALGKIMLQGHRVTMDSQIEHCINVYFEGNGKPPTKFMRTEDRLFAYRPDSGYLKEVADSKRMYPPTTKNGIMKHRQTQLTSIEEGDEPIEPTTKKNISWGDDKLETVLSDDATVTTAEETEYDSDATFTTATNEYDSDSDSLILSDGDANDC